MRLGNQRVAVIFYVHIMKLTLWYPSHPLISLSFCWGYSTFSCTHSTFQSVWWQYTAGQPHQPKWGTTSTVSWTVPFNKFPTTNTRCFWSTSPLGLDQIRNHCPCFGHLGVKKDQWKRSSSSGAVHILQTVLYQYTLLLRQGSQAIIDPNTDTSWIS